ncbi:MAG: hypothetical protein ACXWL2_01855 [Candidatus Chromulinivorax sp.]
MKEIFVDIVDERDEVIQPRPLSYVMQQGLAAQIRMIKLFIKNYDKELLLCRKIVENREKNLFDTPLTAIVHAGESYEEALLRAAEEFLGFDLADMPYHELGKLTPEEDKTESFVMVYELTYNQLPDFKMAIFNDFMWEKPLDCITLFSQNGQAHHELAICLKAFYFDCKDNVSC